MTVIATAIVSYSIQMECNGQIFLVAVDSIFDTKCVVIGSFNALNMKLYYLLLFMNTATSSAYWTQCYFLYLVKQF